MRYLSLFMLVAACGPKSTSTETPAPEETAKPPTCQDVGDRTARDVGAELPPDVPADAGARFGAMIAELCTRDAWPQDVIDCGMSAEQPREECSPRLSAEQRAHIDEAQAAFGEALMAEMAGGSTEDLLESIGDDDCDAFRWSVAVLAACPDARTEMGEPSVQHLIVYARSLRSMAPDELGEHIQACRSSIAGIKMVTDAHGCAPG